MLKLTNEQPRCWSENLNEVQTMVSASRITPYQASFGVRSRVPKYLTPSALMEEHLHNLYVAHTFLTEYHKIQKAKYKEKEPTEA